VGLPLMVGYPDDGAGASASGVGAQYVESARLLRGWPHMLWWPHWRRSFQVRAVRAGEATEYFDFNGDGAGSSGVAYLLLVP